MKTKLTQLATAAAISALLAGTALAQTSTTPNTRSNTPNSATTADMGNSASVQRDEVRASKLVGSTVYNEQDQSVGSVDDVLITHDTKQPVQAVISVGGFLGIGSKLVEVPYDRLKFEANNKVVMPNASRDELRGMQSFSYNTLEHSGTTNASGSSSSTYGNASTTTGSMMGTPSGVGSTTTTTTPNGTTHTTTTNPDGTTNTTTTR